MGALAIAVAQILNAALTALAPILVALTPLFQAFAEQLAINMVAAIQAVTPFLVGLAQFMSDHPGLVFGVIGAITGFLAVLKPLGFLLALYLSPLRLIRFAMAAFGVSLATVMTPLGAFGAWMTRVFGGGIISAAAGLMRVLGQAITYRPTQLSFPLLTSLTREVA